MVVSGIAGSMGTTTQLPPAKAPASAFVWRFLAWTYQLPMPITAPPSARIIGMRSANSDDDLPALSWTAVRHSSLMDTTAGVPRAAPSTATALLLECASSCRAASVIVPSFMIARNE